MYFIYLQKLLRRGRMIIQCLQLTEALENPQKTSSAFGLGGFLRIFHASARCKHRIIPVPEAVCLTENQQSPECSRELVPCPRLFPLTQF